MLNQVFEVRGTHFPTRGDFQKLVGVGEPAHQSTWPRGDGVLLRDA